ncbi:hypothetical protein DLD77_10420 [Chitinophaga alhagiae]|uniref:HTH LytTR-type domain-containing protein n=1 Tax=Chitinophaga alhagiae TaxID=2203219 RepID=A0ABM6WDD7_9BACT|nr:LytTR family DNA-binding domain-containing protein [Chitinophaga alhagiae]AWO02080.1 hypothetical protein DLD77_10420 [Chitinophaga alhagiae]
MINQPFFIRKEGGLKRINLKEILVLEAADNYTKFLGPDYFHLVRASLDMSVSLLPENMFVKIHRSFAVAVHHLQEIERDCVKIGGVSLPVSRKFYPELIKQLNIIEAK